MQIEQMNLMYCFISGVLISIWKVLKVLAEYFEKTYDPSNPKLWKVHTRLTGWTFVILALIFSALAWHRFLTESRILFKVIEFVYVSISLQASVGFAYLVNRVWCRGDYFGRPVKTKIWDN
jgi:hypothetical protein